MAGSFAKICIAREAMIKARGLSLSVASQHGAKHKQKGGRRGWKKGGES